MESRWWSRCVRCRRPGPVSGPTSVTWALTTRSCGCFAFRRPRATRCRKNYSTVTTGVSTLAALFFSVRGRGARSQAEASPPKAPRVARLGLESPIGVVQPTTDVNRLPPFRSITPRPRARSRNLRNAALWTARGTSCELGVDFSTPDPQAWGPRPPHGPYGPRSRPTAGWLRPRCRSSRPCRRARRRSRAPGSRSGRRPHGPARCGPRTRSGRCPTGRRRRPRSETVSGTERVTPRTVSSPSTDQVPLPAGVTFVER